MPSQGLQDPRCDPHRPRYFLVTENNAHEMPDWTAYTRRDKALADARAQARDDGDRSTADAYHPSAPYAYHVYQAEWTGDSRQGGYGWQPTWQYDAVATYYVQHRGGSFDALEPDFEPEATLGLDQPDHDCNFPDHCERCDPPADQYGTPEHEQVLIEEEREAERWSAASYQDALSEIGKRETEGIASVYELAGAQEPDDAPLSPAHQTEVVVQEPWLAILRQPGPRPFGPDDTERAELPAGTRLQRWPTTLTLLGPAGQDAALVLPGRGTILVECHIYADLLRHGVLREQDR